MTLVASPQVSSAARVRSVGIDRARGLAILLMIGDHLSIFYGLDLYRETLGRVAMPLFFVLSGYLVKKVSWRHGWVLALGLALPLVVPWIDRPNVLVWLGLFGALLAWVDAPRWLLGLAVVAALASGANGYLTLWGSSYAPGGLLGLMAFGQLMRRSTTVDPWASWRRLPAWFGLIGRFPLSWYVGHLLLIEGTRQLVLWRV